MTRRNITAACAAACAAIVLAAASAPTALAVENEIAPQGYGDNLALANRAMYMGAMDAPPQEDGLLQTQLRERGLGGSWLAENDIHLSGYVEVGYSFNFVRPPDGSNGANGTGRVFDEKSDDLRLHQISLKAERLPLVSGDRFDMGFGAQVIFGSDARFTQANGSNFYGSGYASRRSVGIFPGFTVPFIDEGGFFGQQYPENQLDILQLYATFNVPFGNGMVVKAGKFVTPFGIEKIDPTQNWLYSHSYIFSSATPRTLTGVIASYKLDDQFTVGGGLVVGWDQTIFEDNNDFPSLLAQFGYAYSKELSFEVSALVGPEQEGNRSDYRWTLDSTMTWRAASDVDVAAEIVVGYEPDVGSGIRFGTSNTTGQAFLARALTGGDAFWFGAAGYVNYRFDESGMFALNFRGEYFNDNDGAFLIANEIYAGSIGLNIIPFVKDEIGKNLIFRPEIRYDWSIEKVFDGNSRNNQITLGADLIFKF